MTKRTRDSLDRRDLANYSLAEAAHWLGLKPGRLRVWFLGQTDPGERSRRRIQPVLAPAATRPLTLSFWNLVECSVLAAIRDEHGVSLQKARKALRYVAKELGKARPLIDEDFSTDGVHLFVERYGKLVSASQQGQIAMREVLQAGLRRIERDEAGLASRLFPWRVDPTEPRIIAVDPGVSFGRPILAGTRVPVDIVFERFRSGDSIRHLAKEYDVPPETIEDLVRKWFGAAAA